MPTLKELLAARVPAWRQEVKALLERHKDAEASKVTVGQAYSGMAGVKALVCDTSSVQPELGLVVRGIPVKELADRSPEEVFFLLCSGSLPDEEGLRGLQDELARRCEVPAYAWDVLDAMPGDAHPVCMLSAAVLSMERESAFRRRYHEGMRKDEHWVWALEDSLNILARLPAVAAAIYRRRYGKGPRLAPAPGLDWASGFARLLGLPDPDGDLTRLLGLYLVLHCDHEGGNVSALAASVAGSALADPYYALSAGLNGLAGPLHGLAGQEALRWLQRLLERSGGLPSREAVARYVLETLDSGRIVPGYGHAVLRVTDPRFDCLLAFGKKRCPDYPLFRLVELVYEVAPGVLKGVEKISDPWPNVDAASGALLHRHGLVEPEFYAALFGVARAMGVCAQAVVARAMNYPMARPASVTTEWMKHKAAA